MNCTVQLFTTARWRTGSYARCWHAFRRFWGERWRVTLPCFGRQSGSNRHAVRNSWSISVTDPRSGLLCFRYISFCYCCCLCPCLCLCVSGAQWSPASGAEPRVSLLKTYWKRSRWADDLLCWSLTARKYRLAFSSVWRLSNVAFYVGFEVD